MAAQSDPYTSHYECGILEGISLAVSLICALILELGPKLGHPS